MSKTFHRGYKYRIYPTEEQKNKLNEFIDLHRAIYNWGVEQEENIYQLYKEGKAEYGFYSPNTLCSLFTIERRKPGNEWMKEIPTYTARTALRDVTNAYKMFFKGINKYPKFKKKGKCKKSFGTRNDRIIIDKNGIKIEGMKDSYIDLGFDCGMDLNRVINPVITLDHFGDYYISFSLEEEIKDLDIPKTDGIGIDLGTRQTFTLSNGEIYNQPREKLKRLGNRLKRIDRHITRDRKRRYELSMHTRTKYEDIPKSKRELKRENKRNKILRKKHNIKNTFYHTIIKREVIDKNPAFVCMETFLVRQIQKESPYMNDKLAQVSFYTITQMVKDKCEKYNIPFIQAPSDFASTQICSNCGNKKKMYNYHIYKCPVCGMVEDRDINAAINLKNYGSQFVV